MVQGRIFKFKTLFRKFGTGEAKLQIRYTYRIAVCLLYYYFFIFYLVIKIPGVKNKDSIIIIIIIYYYYYYHFFHFIVYLVYEFMLNKIKSGKFHLRHNIIPPKGRGQGPGPKF